MPPASSSSQLIQLRPSTTTSSSESCSRCESSCPAETENNHLFIWRRKSKFQLLQKAKNREQTLRNLRISMRGNSMRLTLNHYTSASSSHGLITKPLSLLLPAFFLSFSHSVKLFTQLPHPHSVFQDFSLSYFPSLSLKNCQK